MFGKWFDWSSSKWDWTLCKGFGSGVNVHSRRDSLQQGSDEGLDFQEDRWGNRQSRFFLSLSLSWTGKGTTNGWRKRLRASPRRATGNGNGLGARKEEGGNAIENIGKYIIDQKNEGGASESAAKFEWLQPGWPKRDCRRGQRRNGFGKDCLTYVKWVQKWLPVIEGGNWKYYAQRWTECNVECYLKLGGEEGKHFQEFRPLERRIDTHRGNDLLRF